MEEIDAQIAACNAEMEHIASKKLILTADLDVQWRNCQKKRSELKIAREKAFYATYPVLYVIHGHAEARNNHYVNYSNFDRIVACFTTREAAIAALGDRTRTNGSHHDITYKVKAEATENIPQDILEKLNVQHFRGLDWSP